MNMVFALLVLMLEPCLAGEPVLPPMEPPEESEPTQKKKPVRRPRQTKPIETKTQISDEDFRKIQVLEKLRAYGEQQRQVLLKITKEHAAKRKREYDNISKSKPRYVAGRGPEKDAYLRGLNAWEVKRNRAHGYWRKFEDQLSKLKKQKGKYIPYLKLEPGSIGLVGEIKVTQIAGPAAALGKIKGQDVWIVMPTGGLVDNKTYTDKAIYQYLGTKTYTTVLGASRTVHAVERVLESE